MHAVEKADGNTSKQHMHPYRWHSALLLVDRLEMLMVRSRQEVEVAVRLVVGAAAHFQAVVVHNPVRHIKLVNTPERVQTKVK